MKFSLKQFKDKFIKEANEKIDSLIQGLILLESQPENPDIVQELMRDAHTLKGSSKMMGFGEISKLAHELEEEFLELMGSRKRPDNKIITSLLHKIDSIKELIHDIAVSDEKKKEVEKEKKEEKKEPKKKKVSVKEIKKPIIQYTKVDIDELESIISRLENTFLELNSVISGFSVKEKDEKFLKETLTRIALNLNVSLKKLREFQLIPISSVFDILPRQVRDLSLSLGKEVTLKIEGRDTFVEKRIAESLSEPLVHIIRNAIDHGIEPPDEREKVGKPRKGTIIVRAYQEKGKVYIEVKDDGRGIDWEKVKKRAIKKNIISKDKKEITKADLIKALTTPGFSTKDKTTEISGRGVGMDIVLNVVEKLKGTFSIDSKKGKGTKITMIFPVSISLLETLIIKVGENIFGLPLYNVEKILDIRKSEIFNKNQKAYIMDGEEPVQILDISELFEFAEFESNFFIILNNGIEKSAIPVTSIISRTVIVLKEVPFHLKSYRYLLGASVIKSGELILILDPLFLGEIIRETIPFSSLKEEVSKGKVIKVLVVEDSELTREIVRNMFEQEGCEVFTAKNGIDALSKVEDVLPDLIVSDIDMPEMDGYEFLSNLKEKKMSIPFYFLTSRENEIEKVEEAGADGFLRKSEFTAETVKRIIRRIDNEL